MKPRGLPRRAFRQARKIFERLALREREPENVVRAIVVALDIHPARRFCDDRKRLQRDISFEKSRNVRLSDLGFFQQIAIP